LAGLVPGPNCEDHTMTRTDYTLALDAKYDLHAANLDASDEAVEKFSAAYHDAARRLADELGIAIDVIEVNGYGSSEDTSDKTDEANDLWQRIHDMVHTQ
jgi:hypothetical protein